MNPYLNLSRNELLVEIAERDMTIDDLKGDIEFLTRELERKESIIISLRKENDRLFRNLDDLTYGDEIW